jgi:serine/threonine protein kinase
MAKVIPIGKTTNDSERRAIAHLRDTLPANYSVLHNLELARGAEIFEIDLIVLAPHCVFVVDVKGAQGTIEVIGAKWYPLERQPFHSPLAKLRQHAKVLKTLICDTYPHKPELRRVHVHAAVLMTAPNAQLVDRGGLDGPDVTYLDKCAAYFQDKSHVPGSRADDIRTLLSTIEQAIRGKAKPKSGAPRFRDWQADEKLGGDDRYTEYRASNTFIGHRAGTARLRVYKVDPYQDAAAQETQRRLISNAFRAVAQMPAHPNILAVREFFGTEEGDKLILVTEDLAGSALQQHIKRASLALTFDQKLGIIRDVLTALDHAHRHGIVHRNLSPDSILIGADGHARLSAFDYARVGQNRQSTIAGEVVDDLDTRFQAPEAYRDPANATALSDLFSAGLIFYEMLTGEPAFASTEQMVDAEAIFAVKPSELKPDLPAGLDEWLQKLCAFNPVDRFPDAAHALHELSSLFTPAEDAGATTVNTNEEQAAPPGDLYDLPRDFVLAGRFHIQERLGEPGGFAVAYKVYDNLGDVVRVLKLVTRDRHSVYERLKREYQTLNRIPRHQNVVEVLWADRLPDETPYILFEYVDGLDVERQINRQALSREDAFRIAREVATGLKHLHNHGVYHQDIKPSNLLWTGNGVRIIDFNVAVSEHEDQAPGGGTRRYIPPDFDITVDATAAEKIDRDVYALAVTFYECLTGNYPFAEPSPPSNKLARDPRSFPGCEDLSDKLVDLLYRALSPHRSDRFSSAQSFLNALSSLSASGDLRKPKLQKVATHELSTPLQINLTPPKPNFNPFVSYLLTLYSQSKQTNAGTRGLDSVGEMTYVSTLLDTALQPAVLGGEFKLVIISGNAGDGKTAFVQQLERQAEREKAALTRKANGSTFELRGRRFFTNYDGSQDEGDKVNDDVLLDFFSPFSGADEARWAVGETRIIAINEGRLVDFLSACEHRFPRLIQLVKDGLRGTEPEGGVAVINLNLRAVVADLNGQSSSIFDRLMRRFTDPRLWEACKSCDLKGQCYIYHNAQTFMDETAGVHVTERLKTLHMVAHMRGRLHVTLRDLRSALAFMLAGTRDCDEVHDLYRNGGAQATQEILDGYYFNSWMGGRRGSPDRLISLLRETDIGETSNPELDRFFALLEPDDRELQRFSFSDRSRYADDLLQKLFADLPSDFTGKASAERRRAYRRYIAMMRRRYYFERRDEGWREMLPHYSAGRFLSIVLEENDLDSFVPKLLSAINRGEGLRNHTRLGQKLALRVRQVNKGTIRSYRLFDRPSFTLHRPRLAGSERFIEYLPQQLILRYQSKTGQHRAELGINLDVYEMLEHLNEGYRPSIEQQEGFYRNLTVFKNLLGSAPYQEVLLTESGHEFYRINRDESGALTLEPLRGKGLHESQGAR